MIYLLLLIIVIIFLIVLKLDKDFFSPSAIICESYILATLCAIYNIKTWGINLSIGTVKLILIGIMSFVIPSTFILLFGKKKKHTNVDKNNAEIKFKFKFNNQLMYVLVFTQILTTILYLYYVVKTVGLGFSLSSFSYIMNYYRENTSYGDLESLVPTYVNQLVKISKIVAFINLYNIILNKILYKKNGFKYKIKAYEILSIISFIITSLLRGGRYGLIAFCLGAMVMWKILSDSVYEEKNKLNLKKIIKVMGIIILLVVAFSNLRTFVGRTNNDGIVEYVTKYFGGSIQGLDMFLKNPISKSNIWGKETFYAINRTLSKFGVSESYQMHLEFRTSNGVSIGNVYTAFRSFYYDFGIFGVVFLQVILSIFWTVFYKIIRNDDDYLNFNSKIIFYCMFISCLFLHSYRDNFFSTVISVSTISVIIYFIIIKLLVVLKNK